MADVIIFMVPWVFFKSTLYIRMNFRVWILAHGYSFKIFLSTEF